MDILAEARKLRRYIEQMSVNLDDETALDNVDVFEKWEVDKEYKKDFRLRYNEVLYKVLQDHISQEDWTPDVAVSLFSKVGEGEYPEWVQPIGSHDAYSLGAKVKHLKNEQGLDRHWQSDYDNNVWEPSVYGWSEIFDNE